MLRFGSNYTFWIASFLIFLIDQLTKIIVTNNLDIEEEFVLNKMVSILRIHNEKYIMGHYDVLSGDFSLQSLLQYKILYSTFAILLVLSIVWTVYQNEIQQKSWGTEFAKTGLFFMVGGIFGNLFDIIFRENGVVDFIELNIEHVYPVLNIADFSIYIGFLSILISILIIVPIHFRQKIRNLDY